MQHVLRRAVHKSLRPRALVRERLIRRGFVSTYLGDSTALDAYEREIRESGLVEHLRERRREFADAIRAVDDGGAPWTIGAIAPEEGVRLYSILRTLKPRVAVETGVCNGFSTAFALLALQRNGAGELHSIDLPRVAGRVEAPGSFYPGKGRAGVPEGKQPGWLIPDDLRERWTLILGRSQDELPPLLSRLGAIDFFMHDSEHSFECMWFEYTEAFAALRDGGVLMSDDVNATAAFFQFAEQHRRAPIKIGPGIAFVVK